MKRLRSPFVVRPKGILSTPKLVANDLGWKTRYYPNPRFPDRMYSYMRDFLMMPVDPEDLRGVTHEYLNYYNFSARNKYEQRLLLRDGGVPVPRTAGSHGEAYELAYIPDGKFVVRGLRHSGGRGYRVTESPTDFIPGQQYISELYPKKREYRVIFIYGKPVIWMRKKPHEGVDPSAPWGHVNSNFQTIEDVAGCRLASTDCAARLSAFPAVKGAHIIAADILYNSKAQQPYVVLELNACPALTIEENRDKIVSIIRMKHAPTVSYSYISQATGD